MTDGEIRTSYQYAVNKKEQLEILAQLNGCSVGRIIKKLNAMGIETVEPKKKTTKKKANRWSADDVVQLLDLWHKGKSLRNISKEIGRSEVAIKAVLYRLDPNTEPPPTAEMNKGLKMWRKQQILKTG